MTTLADYQLSECLYEGTRTEVYRGISNSDRASVIVKILRQSHPNFTQLVQFRNQYAIARHLQHPNILTPIALERYGNGYALIMPDDGAIALHDYWQQETPNTEEFLEIALQLADALHYLGQEQIIHKDIKPANILICPETKQVKLIDFSISTLLPKETQTIQTAVLEGTLAYLSPEQTGRMNRGIDYRSDFYALGVTFYELLTGTVPFASDDPLELIHAHIAQSPKPIVSVRIPEVLSDIVLKLMAKNAEDRYQSALGLRYDLDSCSAQYQETKTIVPFALGEQDRCDRFLIPEKLYGRESEVQTLLDAFERVANPDGGSPRTSGGQLVASPSSPSSPSSQSSQSSPSSLHPTPYTLHPSNVANPPKSPLTKGGLDVANPPSSQSSPSSLHPTPYTPHPSSSLHPSSEMMLVAGFSGIGKTAVINEVHKPITRQHGYFIKGKFDQFNRNIPFSAFVQAFQELIEQLLGFSDAEMESWKAAILEALGDNGQVIIDVIPQLEQIIGKQSPVIELEGSAAQNRFNLLFSKFIRVFTTKEHPLVIFLDDLQWADLASLNLLKLLMDDSEAGYLLVLGAYRDNEVFPAHPLMLTLGEIEKQGATINRVTLAALSELEITDLVADTLRCSAKQASPLAKLVYQKTQGNPFFTTQFLKGLYEDDWITFNADAGYWQCDMVQIHQLSLTSDVVEFMMRRLQKLSIETQEVMKIAACIGNEFKLETLALVSEKTPEETACNLWAALAEGLILPETEIYKFYLDNADESLQNKGSNPLYKFLHDRVQQAAYGLIDEERKQQTHLEIGRRLLANMNEQADNIFEVADHLNRAAELISDRSGRDEIARLNLLAAQKAKSTTAYAAAKDYANAGRSLLAENSWSTQYDLTFNLSVTSLEAEFLNTNYEAVESLAKIVLAQAKTMLDRVKVYEVLIQADIGQNKMQQVIDTGLQVLEMLEISLSDDPRDAIENLQQLIDLPEMSDRHKLAAMNILGNIITTAWMIDPQLFKQITFTMVDISLKYGNCSCSVVGYAWYSMLLCEGLGDIEIGYELGELSVRLIERLNALEIKSQVLNVVAGVSRLWKQHTKDCIKLELEGFQSGLESGDFECASYSAAEYCDYLLIVGQNLDFVNEEFQKYRGTIERLKQDYHLDYMAAWQQTIWNLQGKSTNRTQVFSENAEAEVQHLEKLLKEEQIVIVYHAHVLKTFLSYLFKDYESAVQNAILLIPEAKENGNNMFAIPAILYSSLAFIAWIREAEGAERENYLKQYLKQVDENLLKMEHWAKHAPINYQHQCDMIKAEKARMLGNKWQAVEFYKRARVGAKENEYLHHEAMSCELTAEFYLEQEMPEVAQVYLTDAYYTYARWGANAKLEDLAQRYRQLLAPILKPEKKQIETQGTFNNITAIQVNSTSSTSSSFFDLSSVIKNSQALSGEMNLEQLLSNLMEVVMENAGATKAALLLPKEETLFIEAIASAAAIASDTEQLQKIRISSLGTSLPLSSDQEVPTSIINTVWRTRETLVLNDVMKQPRFASDSYLNRCLPKSVLCVPLLNQGKLIALLYLENKLTIGAFTSDRLEILKLLGAQAAISIENARLYGRLEDYSHNLEEKVELRTEQLQEKNQSLQQTLDKLQRTQAQLIQTEKMSSLGQMVAGMAHEINNPITFISGNIGHARDYVQDLLALLDLLLDFYEQNSPELDTAIEEKIEAIDLDYLRDDLKKLFDSMQNGSDRIRKIILGLRNFSRLDEAEYKRVDIHEGLDNTLLILQHRLKSHTPEISLVKKYGELPLVQCYANQLNQVFLNLLGNAIDVLRMSETGQHPQIAIATQMKDSQTVRISIGDNGPGMSENLRQKVFDPFFTTKPVGQGTGLGLSTSYQIITEQHGGQLHCCSEPGKGTEFVIEIPISLPFDRKN